MLIIICRCCLTQAVCHIFFFPCGFNNLLPYKHTEGRWNKPRDTLTNTTVRWHKNMSHQHTQKQVCTPNHTVPQMRHCLNVIQSVQYFTTVMKDPLVPSAASPWGKTGSGTQIVKLQRTTGAFKPPATFLCHTWLTNTLLHNIFVHAKSTWSRALWSVFKIIFAASYFFVSAIASKASDLCLLR